MIALWSFCPPLCACSHCIISCTADKAMAQEMNTVRDIPDAAEILKKYGYYHITEDFLSALIHYANLMNQTGMLPKKKNTDPCPA